MVLVVLAHDGCDHDGDDDGDDDDDQNNKNNKQKRKEKERSTLLEQLDCMWLEKKIRACSSTPQKH
eukprot:1734184-Rhodomonas_salina.2